MADALRPSSDPLPHAGEGSRAAVEAEWLQLTREVLPGLARERDWPIRNDHCFQRVALDNAFEGVWYDFIAARPAYRVIDEAALRRAVDWARRFRDEPDSLPPANTASLRWRGKA